MRTRGSIVDEHHVHVATEQPLNRGARAAIGHLVELDTGRLLEQHGGEMERVSDAGVRDIDLARLPLGLVDQLGHGIDLELVGIGYQYTQEAGGERHWREILGGIEWQLLVETGISGIGRDITEQHGVAVGWRLGDEIGAEIGRRPGLFSTTIGWPTSSDIFCPTSRAKKSVPPPAG